MKKGKIFSLISLPLIILGIILLFFLDPKIILMSIFSILLLVGYIIYKEKIGQELIVAFILAFALTSYYSYVYASSNIMIGKINLFPLISWTFGLVFLREVYERLNKDKFSIILLIYILGLFIVEYIGYYLLEIRLNSNLPSLLGLGIIHAPTEIRYFIYL